MARDVEAELIEFIGSFAYDPLGFVLAVYPWGEGELAKHTGPRKWQREVLEDIGQRLKAGLDAKQLMPILKAIASGHGIGKSALVGWLIHWALSTYPDTKVLLTANTEQQLRTKTWPEVSKWFRLAINAHWFRVQGTSIVTVDAKHEKTWRCDYVTWSENNLAAFAGLHNQGRRILIVFDEASGIHDKVWETTEGALTDEDTEIIWFVPGNPTEPKGRFFECFHRERQRWHGAQIDSRTVEGTNKALFDQWVVLYGEDSDFVRVRVAGKFPRTGSMQFIPSEDIQGAAEREAAASLHDPFILGVDVARFGDDQSVICFRKGRDARTHAPIRLRQVDTMTLAARVAEEYDRYKADAVFVDGGGVGAGVVDRLRQLAVPVFEVQFGAKADRITHDDTRPGYANKRAEMWGNMREWLKGGAIPDDPELRQDLSGPQYSFVVREGRDVIMLERKEDMKERGLASPDWGDALALTFAYPVMQKQDAGRLGAQSGVQVDYDPFA